MHLRLGQSGSLLVARLLRATAVAESFFSFDEW